jgi:demethylmenaquinone methyltransferase/2-methoxy-6-polyprenyl-1,4-benzoquinol methylase
VIIILYIHDSISIIVFKRNMAENIIKKTDRQPNNVRLMFGRISKRYDLLNRLMSLGFDRGWRRFVIRMAEIPDGGRVLDAGAGTGDIALEIVDYNQSVRVTAADLTYEMITVGKQRAGGRF